MARSYRHGSPWLNILRSARLPIKHCSLATTCVAWMQALLSPDRVPPAGASTARSWSARYSFP